MKNEDYNALTPREDALNIIKKCFQNEKKGKKTAREEAKEDLKKCLIKTDDGSYTLSSNNFNGKSETMHTTHGAINESIEKFVKPAKLKDKKEVHILDICSGLGYNAASCIEFLDDKTKIEMDMVEISKETIATALFIDNPLKSYEIIKEAIEEKFYDEGIIGFKFHKERLNDKININIFIDDARNTIKQFQSQKYDAIFLDPFSPLKSPELYSVEFLSLLKYLLKDNGLILTYTSAAPVRAAMICAGLHVGEGPSFGRKSGGTIASKNPEKIEKSLPIDDERMISLSDAGIPFKDPQLKDSSEIIIKRREDERKSVRGIKKFASTVKTPIYLYKDIKNERLKRRVTKSIKMLKTDDLKSKKAGFIVCPQFEECLCTCGIGRLNNSKERINEMANRLSKVTNE
ncbi:MAG: hypothetical protein HZC47_08005 [Methanobacterium sp.]|uniref:tRNA (5-methylaminomethyl-2-thiouridine)(34)-methyltransferase MnmD n=1 Tax=Methanobacterium sp. TaxID=2164 RepID=UPI003D6592EE|nr:hypothetical protein [Methanobacterium sp.]